MQDEVLLRPVALKVLRAERTDAAGVVARFVEEAQLTAQLDHPGIVAVHDLGRLTDGTLYYTMKVVRGRTLEDVFAEPGDPGALRRRVALLQRAVGAVAYAHDRGVLHRDLKPTNILVGDYGDVLVADWGLGRVLAGGAPHDHTPTTARTRGDVALTRAGRGAGTLGYAAPEQAAGDHASTGPAADVFSLGAILGRLLLGHRPAPGVSADPSLLWTALDERGAHDPVEAELVELVRRATDPDPARRPPDARALHGRLEAWLDGANRRERAIALVADAHDALAEASAAQERGRALQREAKAQLGTVPLDGPIEAKAPGWAKEDAARADLRDAALRRTRVIELLGTALQLAPELADAHDLLADVHRADLEEAEEAGDPDRAASAELRLRAHDRGRHAAWLRGDGALSLRTSPPGARARLFRVVEEGRRLVRRFERELGTTPLVEATLPRGRWLVELSADGHETVTYPVTIRRLEHWDGVAPGDAEPTTVDLPRVGELGPNDRYVPGGWFEAGDPPHGGDTLPRSRVWIDAFVMRAAPVTNGEYLAYLNELVAAGRVDEAIARAPRERAGEEHGRHGIIYGRRADDTFFLTEDADGWFWSPDVPVVMVSWRSASAYARDLAAATGLPWRLPWEIEWEKAGRGVDGRRFPWGDHFEPTWLHHPISTPDPLGPTPPEAHPLDVSVYGVFGLGGNVVDWCADRYTPQPPSLDGRRFRVPSGEGPAETEPARRVIRGGSRYQVSAPELTARLSYPSTTRTGSNGFRLVRSWEPR